MNLGKCQNKRGKSALSLPKPRQRTHLDAIRSPCQEQKRRDRSVTGPAFRMRKSEEDSRLSGSRGAASRRRLPGPARSKPENKALEP